MKSIYIHTEEIHNTSAASEVVPILQSWFNAKSIIDIGCGTGTWLKVAKSLGVKNVLGVDGDHVPREMLQISEEEFISKDLCQGFDLKQKFDLVLSLEVAEHLPESVSETFVDSLCKHGNLIVFSAAVPGQGGQNHLNEQWPTYWNEKFIKRGYKIYDVVKALIWNNDKIEYWYKQNIVLYSSEDISALFTERKTLISPVIHPETFNKMIEEVKFWRQLYERQQARGPLSLFKEGIKKIFGK